MRTNENAKFLEAVATDLYAKMGSELADIAIVFPNKRASLFFNEYLAKLSDRPIWSPTYISIKELMVSLSDLKIADPIKLLCILYDVFKEETNTQESFDDFYYWGELLLNDFDDLDKNKVNSEQLFQNLHDLYQLTDTDSFFDDEQREALATFFRNYSIEKQTDLKQQFATLWEQFGSIYNIFRSRLEAEGLAYEGMLYRQAVEQLDTDKLPYRCYLFVGFNVLNQVETSLFDSLQKAGKALFYWDYDQFYTKSHDGVRHEAGEFILRNLKRFGNELPETFFDHLRHNKQIRFIASSTESAQVRYISQWYESNHEETLRENAIVLCNESLLLPLLHTIPQQAEHINITMGFPLAQTPAYSLITSLLELQLDGFVRDKSSFAREQVLQTLRHPYICKLIPQSQQWEEAILKKNIFFPKQASLQQDEQTTLLFSSHNNAKTLCHYLLQIIELSTAIYSESKHPSDEDEDENNETQDILDQLFQEALFKCYTTINRLSSLIEEGVLHIQTSTLRHLIQKLLLSINIPFHGEPAIGLQVMGVLETRTLDFRKLLLLSVNEGQLPKSINDTSFIPYNLRKAFGMTTVDLKNAVYAYYFYRMIQRAEQVTFIYNNSTDGLVRGEMSRFLLQLQVEWPHHIEHKFIQTKQLPMQAEPIALAQSPEILSKLCNRFDASSNPKRILSPSALNCYLNCALKFYFQYVEQLTVSREHSTEIDPAMFGSIFHKAVEIIYTELRQRDSLITQDRLKAILDDPILIDNYIDRAFKEEFYKVPQEQLVEYTGSELLKFRVISSYVKQLLQVDIRYTPFHIEALEESIFEERSLHIPSLDRSINIRLGGIADRIDLKDDGVMRIVDYKTGGSPKTFSDIAELFVPKDKRASHILQACLYSAIMTKQRNTPIAPAILYIGKASQEDYNPIVARKEGRNSISVCDFSIYADAFHEELDQLIAKIFASDAVYTQTPFKSHCEYCDYRKVCNTANP